MAYGVINADLMTTSDGVSSAGTYGMKSRIINGAMVIDQRNAGASGTATGYTVDRWSYNATQSSKGTWQQNAGSVTPPVGFKNYLGFTSSSAYSVVAGDYFAFQQIIEGYNIADLAWGTANAQTVTLSFWVRSSLTGTFGGALQNSGLGQMYPFSYTISSANTWEQKSITIAGSVSSTWLSTNGAGLYLVLSLGAGSTWSQTAGAWTTSLAFTATGATSVVGTNGATFYITGVQLEKGSTATSFDYRPYSAELAMCQRYYWQLDETTGGQYTWGTGANGSTDSIFVVQNPVYMRAAPTAGLTGSVTVYTNVSNATKTSYSSTTTGTRSSRVLFSLVGLGGAACWSDFVSGGKLTFSAEL